MKKHVFLVLAIGSLLSTSALALSPTITSLLADMKTGMVIIATGFVVAFFALAAIKFMRYSAHQDKKVRWGGSPGRSRIGSRLATPVAVKPRSPFR